MLWSWILAVVGLVGLVLAGRKIWWCWYINIAAQALWFAYALVTKQYGFIASSVVYAVVFSQNAYKWTKEYREKTLPKPPKYQRHLHIVDFDKREAWCPNTRQWHETGFGQDNCRGCGWIFDSITQDAHRKPHFVFDEYLGANVCACNCPNCTSPDGKHCICQACFCED